MDEKQLKLFEIPDVVHNVVRIGGFDAPIWTENKARLIARYLYYFEMITHHGNYIDGFAGPQEPDQPNSWAAKLVLEIQPAWMRRFWLCEQDRSKIPALESLALEHREKGPANRHIEVMPGDFNASVAAILASGGIRDSEATFCLLDQRTFECHWATVQALAAHKRSAHKIEQFYFLGTKWMDRAFSGLKDMSVVERWWGRADWQALFAARQSQRAELLVARFREELGYQHALAWPIYERDDAGGAVMYHMIHATDHDEAPKLMARAYRRAVFAAEPPEQLKLVFADLSAVKPPST
jgi:three-Cys-motif partner protein